ncbi:transmembrane protein 168-like [Asterias rubens]|uniref:transmembrane protein 168-like n=1 Tax=Asterias rubens TaxID=7604 RepID=UPI001455B787|nr:transmembrane protein 168-like [Asterias rubens]
MEENDSKVKCGLCFVVLDLIVLIFALEVGLCALLISTRIGPIFIVIVALIVIGLAIVIGVCLYCCKPNYKGNDSLSKEVNMCNRLWCSFVLGLMSFVDISGIHNYVITVTTWMLVASIIIKAVSSFIQRCHGLIKYSSSPVSEVEMFELFVFSMTGLIALPEDQAFLSKYALCLIFVSFAVIIVAVRLAGCIYNPFKILILIAVLVCQIVFFNTIDVPFYNAALGCFVGRLFMDPLFDLFSSNITAIERLNCVFSVRECLQQMFVIIVIVFEGVFLFHAVVSDIYHKEWYWIILFVVLLIFWICNHSYSIHLFWQFSNNISECTKAHQALQNNTSMEMIMATKGMRSQTQFIHHLALYTFVSTLFLGAATLLIPCVVHQWHKEDKAALAASFLIVVLVEEMFYAATDLLQQSLPGACTACVIMPPSKSQRQSELKDLQRFIMEFFGKNNIPCSIESFVDGLSIQTLECKIQYFFAQTTDTSHRRYDSYVVFYCGDVDSDGNWELTGGKFKFENMQRLWNNCDTEGFQSRLILIQDAKHSEDWLEKIAHNKNNRIAMQTCKLSPSVDPETGVVARVGDFTRDWVEFNSSTENSINWKESGREIKAVYKVSPPWSDHDFHVPNEEDIREFATKFPKIMTFLISSNLYATQFERKHCFPCWERLMMSWYPPPSVDTGHGFKLVKS